jgi:NADH:ubiquinone oxidoreductase subunit 3 (subunit A)
MDFLDSPYLLLAIVIVAVVAIAITCIFIADNIADKEARKRKDRLLAEAKQFYRDIDSSRSLPVVSTNLMLEAGEVAFFSAPTPLMETRAVRQSRSGHVGVRVAKGVYAGSSQGTSVSTQEWTQIDEGQLVITNRRIIFQGTSTTRSIKFPKVLSIDYDLSEATGVVLMAVEGRQKNMAFQASNPAVLSAIVQLCKQVDDPLDLSGLTFQMNVFE